ncbi:MAG TPA: AAA family ATPase [Gaiellaceae bacterium]|nr:AAA family ATPase [Gaiellaceae bacterium]
MAVAEAPVPVTSMLGESQTALTLEWRRLTRVATLIAVLMSPSIFYWYYDHYHWRFWWALAGTVFTVMAFRGLVDVVVRKLIPWPSLFGMDDVKVKDNDIVNRRRAWTWRWFYRLVVRVIIWLAIIDVLRRVFSSLFGLGWNVTYTNWVGHLGHSVNNSWHALQGQGAAVILFQLIQGLIFLPIMIGAFVVPMLGVGLSQIRAFEPGDAEWGVKLEDIRGQKHAKEEVRRVVTLWQSGEHFEKAGGKRERGLLFLGPPGTGKTMLAKGIATTFNSPFVTFPGSGFAQAFMGMDSVMVRLLVRRARKLARKWGGQCIIFIDEIDAVGMRRASLGYDGYQPIDEQKPEFFGRHGAMNPSGDMICESREWRDWLFEQRAPGRPQRYPGWYQKLVRTMDPAIFPGNMMGGQGQLALQQLLIAMDGVQNPPFFRRLLVNKINSVLDASYVVPRRIGKYSLRIPKLQVKGAEVYFIGATNAPIEALDPALIRPGRMGRHVSFRTPNKDDRIDIFDLYLGKVSHEPALDTPEKRDEIARITNGYSPAMIDQICSMALTRAHHDGRLEFNWGDLVDSMVIIESGTESGFEYTPHEAKAVAVHEAGHAVAAHIYRQSVESSRLSIKRRGETGGHHQSFEKEDRFSYFQDELIARVIHSVGAMAAEIVFYDENSWGVGGDLNTATWFVANMAGRWGMAPRPLDLKGATFADETQEQSEQRVKRRFEDIGMRLMNRVADNPALQDPRKRSYAAQMLGESFVTAYNAMVVNKEAVDRIAEAVFEKQEIYGDELVSLLDGQHLVTPTIDWTDEASWPKIDWSRNDKPWEELFKNGPPAGGMQ